MEYTDRRRIGRRQKRRPLEAGITLIEVLVVAGCLAALTILIISNLPNATQQTAVSVCQSNLRTIQTAAEQYYAAEQTYPTGTAAAVTTTLFQNPVTTTVTYLGSQPVDPADPTRTGTYKWTYTAPTATTAGHYTITCPGVHPKETLSALPGASTETTGTITLDSIQNLYTN